MVAAIAAIGGPGVMASLGSLGIAARNGRPLAVGAATTTGDQLPVRKVPRQPPPPLPSAEVKISDAGMRALAAADIQVSSKSGLVARESAALARANGAAAADVGLAGSVSNLAPSDGVSYAASSEAVVSDRALVSLILALLADVRSTDNAAMVAQASHLVASLYSVARFVPYGVVMDILPPRTQAVALRRALVQARTDPRVEAIARSLHLDLTDESVWQRILGQAERNFQRGLEAASRLEPVASSVVCGDWPSNRHAQAAISAYRAIDRL